MSNVAIVSGVIIVLALVGFLMVLPLISDVLFIQQNWEAYWFWYPILANLARIIIVLCAVICFVYPFQNGEVTLWINGVSFILLAVWGIPIAVDALGLLIWTPLSGLELQRTILRYVVIEFWAIGTLASFQRLTDKKEKSE